MACSRQFYNYGHYQGKTTSPLEIPPAVVMLLTLLQTQDVWKKLCSWCFTIVTLIESLLSEQFGQKLTSYQISSQTSSFFMKTAHLSSTSSTLPLSESSPKKLKENPLLLLTLPFFFEEHKRSYLAEHKGCLQSKRTEKVLYMTLALYSKPSDFGQKEWFSVKKHLYFCLFLIKSFEWLQKTSSMACKSYGLVLLYFCGSFWALDCLGCDKKKNTIKKPIPVSVQLV